jgi:hypothetical protein
MRTVVKNFLGSLVGAFIGVAICATVLTGQTAVGNYLSLVLGTGKVPTYVGDGTKSPAASTTTGYIPLVRVVTLTDAQIKSLPTTPITIVAAPASGFRVRALHVSFSVDTNAGAYTNINAMYADIHGGDYGLYGLIDDATPVPALTNLTQILGSAARTVYDVSIPNNAAIGTGIGYVQNTNVETKAAVDAVAFQLAGDNSGSGNWTGGNAANTMKVTLYYVIEAL